MENINLFLFILFNQRFISVYNFTLFFHERSFLLTAKFCSNAILKNKLFKAKLVWNFSGEGALKTTQHHLIHLKEYSEREKVEVVEFGTEQQTESTASAFMIVAKALVNDLRKSLKPHQGFLVE